MPSTYRCTRVIGQLPSRTVPIPTLQALCLGLALSMAATPSSSQTVPEASQETRSYDIPAGPLGAALSTFAALNGVPFSFDPTLTQGKTTAGLQGQHTMQEGFGRLLAGTGLIVVPQPDGGYSLQEAPAGNIARLPAIKVQTTEPDADGSAAQGYRSERVSAVGPWQGRSLQDTPYSITVISKDLIQNLQATTPDQIYRVTPTIQFVRPQAENDQPQVYLRGFRVLTSYRDGLQTANFGHGTATEDADSIEVLTGLSGFLYGPGNVGGLINYIGKRPTVDRLNRVTLGNNGGSNWYAHGDFGGPIDSDGRFGYRVNAVWQDGETAIEHQDIEKRFVSAAFDWHVTDTLEWQFDAAYREYEVERGAQPLWILAAGASRPSAKDLDTSVSWGQQWTNPWFETQRFGTRLRWEANDAFTLRAAWHYNNVRQSLNSAINIVAANGTYTQVISDRDILNADMSGQSGQVFADLRFDTGGIAHKLSTGVQYQRNWQTWFTNGAPSFTYPDLPLDRPTRIDRPARGVDDRGRSGSGNVYSYTTLLISDDIALDERWSLLAGVAHSTIDRQSTHFGPNDAYEKSAVTPNFSLLYKPFETLTTYVSYIESLEQGGVVGREFGGVPVVNAGEVFDPLTSDQMEIGAKWSLGGMLLTSAVFQIDKALEYHDLRNPTAPRFVQDGRQVHRGIELTAFGKVTENLTLTGGITGLDAKVEEQKQNPALEGKRPTSVAEKFAKLRAEYQLPALPALSFSGAVSYTGDQFGNEMNTDRLPSYTLLDVGVRYETAVGQRPLSLRLDINNLADKDYWSWGSSLGTPRTVLFSASAEF